MVVFFVFKEKHTGILVLVKQKYAFKCPKNEFVWAHLVDFVIGICKTETHSDLSSHLTTSSV